MRLSRSLASVTVAFVLVMSLPYEAMSHTRVGHGKPAPQELFGAECRTSVRGSRVVTHCHNPYVDTDRLRLHVECSRWWDLDTDGAPARRRPATTVRLTGRCWKEVGSAWVSHQKVS